MIYGVWGLDKNCYINFISVYQNDSLNKKVHDIYNTCFISYLLLSCQTLFNMVYV